MKKYIFTILLFATVIAIKAQQTAHTLQFSRLIFLTNASGQVTVPIAASNNGVNCAWKVVSLLHGGGGSSSYPNLIVNGTNFGCWNSYWGFPGDGNAFPLWLPAGTTLQIPTSGTDIMGLSIIEFIVN